MANARVDWLALKDDDITEKFPILLEDILQDVFSQRASSAFPGKSSGSQHLKFILEVHLPDIQIVPKVLGLHARIDVWIVTSHAILKQCWSLGEALTL